MNRLLQGDVGSGKTVVAAWLIAISAAQPVMAPTSILAEQHYQSLRYPALRRCLLSDDQIHC
jgi:ATP-dependent DNA helicase RecG